MAMIALAQRAFPRFPFTCSITPSPVIIHYVILPCMLMCRTFAVTYLTLGHVESAVDVDISRLCV